MADDQRRIDVEALRAVCAKGHKMVNCGQGVWRCERCMTERRVIEGGRG